MSGEKIGRYLVEGTLGSGAMGIVYKAYDPMLDRHAAIKLMNTTGEPDSELQQRFLREARSAARLNHPNIVSVYDVGEHDSRHFIAMEYVEGTDLKDLLQKQVFLPFETKIRLMISLSRALNYAHRQGVIHRDIKPGNVRLTPAGEPKILDFGIARLAGGEATRSGKALGSAYYMSPEQITSAEELDGRSDLFSCAIVLYELLTLTRPFEGESPTTICFRIVSEPHTPMDRILPRCPGQLARILDRALSKRPEERQSSCAEFADELTDLLDLDEGRRLELASEVKRLQNEALLLRGALQDLELPGFDVTQYLPLTRPEGDPDDYGNLILVQSRLERQLERARDIYERRTEIQSRFQDAAQMFEKAEWENCLTVLNELRVVCPGNRLLVEMSEKAEAALENQRREEERRRLVKQILAQARSSLQREDFQACLATLQAILGSEPDHPDASRLADAARKGLQLRQCLELAHQRREERDPEGCLQAAGEGLRLAPANRELGQLQQWAVKTRRVADRLLRSAERAAGRTHSLLACRRIELLLRIQPGHRRATDLRSRYLDAWNRSTRADRLWEGADQYFRCGELDTAHQVAQVGIEIDPTNSRLTRLLEEVTQAIGKRETCRSFMEEAHAKVGRGDLPGAIELADKVLEVQPDDAQARDFRASLLAEQAAREKADIFVSAARRALQAGNPALCLKTLEHAKKICPGSPDIGKLERQALGPVWKRLLARWGR